MTPVASGPRPPRPATTVGHQWLWLAGTVLLVSVLAARIAVQAEGANGPWYWRWRWNETSPLRAYPAMALGLLPFLAAQWLFARCRRLVAALLLLTASTLLFALANAAVREPDFSIVRPVTAITENHMVTGYLSEARRYDQESCAQAVAQWLRELPERSPYLTLHNRNKPPGAILYFTVMLHLLGERTALVAGLLVGVLGTLAVPACFLFQRTMGIEHEPAFHGASYLALCPGLIVFFPQFDPLYALFSAVALTLWVAALDRGTVALAASFGLALAVFCFFTYNLLVLGAFIGGFWVWRVASHALPLKVGVRQAALALLALVAAYVLLWATTGYDPIRAFLAAHQNQQALQHSLQRPYPATILYDLLDFMLGSAYVAGVLSVLTLCSSGQLGPRTRQHDILVRLCVGQIFVLALLGLLPAETLRVWAFLLPLLMVPTGLALSRFPLSGRLLFYLSAWLILAVMCQSMDFMFYKKRKRPVRPPEAAVLESTPRGPRPPGSVTRASDKTVKPVDHHPTEDRQLQRIAGLGLAGTGYCAPIAASAFLRAGSNSSPGRQVGASGASATFTPTRKSSCASSTAPARSQSFVRSSDGWW